MVRKKVRWPSLIIHIFFSVVIMAVISALLYAAILPAVFEKNLDLGYKYLYNSEYQKAIAVFEKLIKIDDRKSEVIIPLAASYIGDGREEDAVRILEMVDELNSYEKKTVSDTITVVRHINPDIADTVEDICIGRNNRLSDGASVKLVKLVDESEKYSILELAEKRIAEGDADGASHIIRHIKYPDVDWITNRVIDIIRKIEKKDFQPAEDAYNIIEENNKKNNLPNDFLELRDELGFDRVDGRETKNITDTVTDIFTGENNIVNLIDENTKTDPDDFTAGLAYEDIVEISDRDAEELLTGTWTGKLLSPAEYLPSITEVPGISEFVDDYVFEVEMVFDDSECTFRITNLEDVFGEILEDAGIPRFVSEPFIGALDMGELDGFIFTSGNYSVDGGYLDLAGLNFNFGFTNGHKTLIIEPSEQAVDEFVDSMGLSESDEEVFKELIMKMHTIKLKKK